MKKKSNRDAVRKETAVHLLAVELAETGELLFKKAAVKDASVSGFLIKVSRDEISSQTLRTTLTFEHLIGRIVSFKIDGMNTLMEGTITRTKTLGKAGFELAVDFRHDAPEYWRHCLVDLLPDGSGEF